MTSKERAGYLCNKFLRTYKVSLYPPFIPAQQEAKECALICVDEIITELNNERSIYEDEAHRLDRIYYWQQVKIEIKNL